MAKAYKCLGQVAPLATTLTVLYTVPANTQCVVGSIYICNRGGADTFRVAVQFGGAAIDNSHYIVYDAAIDANETKVLGGISLDETDVVSVYSAGGSMTFNIFGCEIT